MLPKSEQRGIAMDGMKRKEMICARCGLAGLWNGDWFGFLCPSCADELDSADEGEAHAQPRQFRLTVPTYNANYFDKVTNAILTEEYSETNTPVLVHEAAGVRVVLGTHNYDEMDKPDIQIERRANGWAIFLHPEGGGDPSGYVYFLDDGRSFLVIEHHGSTPAIEIVGSVEELEELDVPSRDDGNCESSNDSDKPIFTDDSGPE
jgi:hypothetical protein